MNEQSRFNAVKYIKKDKQSLQNVIAFQYIG